MRGDPPTRDATKLAFVGADFGRRCASAGVRATGSGGLTAIVAGFGAQRGMLVSPHSSCNDGPGRKAVRKRWVDMENIRDRVLRWGCNDAEWSAERSSSI